MRFKDLKGNLYGQLIVIEYSHVNQQGKTYWKCLCTCGNICLKTNSNLQSGSTISCGCYKAPRIKNIVGNTYGKLKVISLSEVKKQRTYWQCLCECGNTKIVSITDLTSGDTKSCGCTWHQKGHLCQNWKGGLTPQSTIVRHSKTYAEWRMTVFNRDDFTCSKCHVRGTTLEAHHIHNFASNLELRFDLDNGITFCKKCHKAFHSLYGLKNNNKTQVDDFTTNV